MVGRTGCVSAFERAKRNARALGASVRHDQTGHAVQAVRSEVSVDQRSDEWFLHEENIAGLDVVLGNDVITARRYCGQVQKAGDGRKLRMGSGCNRWD